MDSGVRGSPQIVQRTYGECYTLHDPFLATVLDFIRRCLDQLARGLKVVIVHTFEKGWGFDKDNFFIGEENKPVNPRDHPSGHDVMYLLKNIKYNVEVYRKILKVEDGKILEIVDFLLDIRNSLFHECYLHVNGSDSQAACTLRKFDTTNECLENSIQLLAWIMCARFYTPIKTEVTRIKMNLENMTDVLEQLRRARQSAEARENNAYNSSKAEELLNWLITQVREEDCEDESCEDRPITHLVNMVLAPRVIRRM